MKRRISIFTCLFFFAFLSNCKKETCSSEFNYNQRANEVIQQVILDESCECIFEIPEESMIKLSLEDNPIMDIRKHIIEKLYLRDRKELDSLEKNTDNFVLDTIFLKKHNIKVLKRDSLRAALSKDSDLIANCPNGILSIIKPIFNKEYKKAVVDYGYAYICIPSPTLIYTYENGKWHRQQR